MRTHFPSVQMICFMLGACLLLNINYAHAAEQITRPASQREQPTHYNSHAQGDLWFNDHIERLYTNQPNTMMWQDKQATLDFEQQLADLSLAGVHPQFAHWLKMIADPAISAQKRDRFLSDALLGYLSYVAGVPTEGDKWLYGQARMPLNPPPTEWINSWQQALSQHRLSEFINKLRPAHVQYQLMQQALQAQLADHHHWPQLTNSGVLRPGMHYAQLASLQKILIQQGYLAATSQEEGQDLYNDPLVDAVKKFQRGYGIAADGIVGGGTRQWLNITPRQKAGLIALNMQRLRLLPDDMHNGIMVNIADYTLNYYLQGKQILTSRVIVGRPDRKTPLMRSALNSVVLNPPWNVPTSLVRRDIFPKAQRDPHYLQQHDFTLYSDWSRDATIIDPLTLNWDELRASNFPYRVQQNPGSKSALGRYKFNMPSSDAIYLHDTPNHTLFQRDYRAVSSGCVRVNKAAELAELLLKNVGWDKTRINDAIKQNTTRYITIKQRIPVSLFYLSAWIDKNHQVQFRTDIYHYDKQFSDDQNTAEIAKQFI